MRKFGCAAEIAAAADGTTELLARPGWMLNGVISRLVDRGYQKFIKTSQFELPATASQLHAIHLFTAELKQLTGAINFYNESLGTISNLYMYDRLKGRETGPSAPHRPWEAAGGH